jgi:hypothetical protein
MWYKQIVYVELILLVYVFNKPKFINCYETLTLYKGTVYISEFKNLFEAFVDILSTSDGLYNYTVSYINTGYISL